MAKTYDVRCYELAAAFLDDAQGHVIWEKDREALASDIQDAIDTYMDELDKRFK